MIPPTKDQGPPLKRTPSWAVATGFLLVIAGIFLAIVWIATQSTELDQFDWGAGLRLLLALAAIWFFFGSSSR